MLILYQLLYLKLGSILVPASSKKQRQIDRLMSVRSNMSFHCMSGVELIELLMKIVWMK